MSNLSDMKVFNPAEIEKAIKEAELQSSLPFNACNETWFHDIDTLDATDEYIDFYCEDDECNHVKFKVRRSDAITIAKHFKLTGDDL